MRVWFKNFLKSFYSWRAILEMKDNKWYWNILYLFIITFFFSGVFILFFIANVANMTNIISIGKEYPNAQINENGIMNYNPKITKSDEDKKEEETYYYKFLGGKINVLFAFGDEVYKNILEIAWNNEQLIAEDNSISEIEDSIASRINLFAGINNKVNNKDIDFKFYKDNKLIKNNKFEYNKSYSFTMESKKFKTTQKMRNFSIIKSKDESTPYRNQNIFIYNSTELIFSTTTFNHYNQVEYKSAKLTNMNFLIKDQWKGMINLMMNYTQYDWLPMTALALYLTITAYIFIYILLFGIILWVITIGAKKKINFNGCIGVVAYSMNLPSLLGIIISAGIHFNVLIGFLMLSIGSLLFMFLILFFHLSGKVRNPEKYLF